MRRQQPDRREFMAVLGGVLAGVSSRSNAGQLASENRAIRRVDVHHHILPPDYIRLVGEQAIGRPAPNGKMPAWDVSSSLRALDEARIATAIVSVSAPWVDDARVAERLAPACNDFAARMTVDHPSRFGSSQLCQCQMCRRACAN